MRATIHSGLTLASREMGKSRSPAPVAHGNGNCGSGNVAHHSLLKNIVFVIAQLFIQLFNYRYTTMKRKQFPWPVLALLLSLLLNATNGDLPSCVRAKCTHCRVPFIAQMCPNQCSQCAQTGAQGQQNGQRQFPISNNNNWEENGSRQQQKVPFAQQLPSPDSNSPPERNTAQQNPTFQTQQFVRPPQNGGGIPYSLPQPYIEDGGQFVRQPYVDYGGQGQLQQNQFAPPQQQFSQPSIIPQQVTSFGGVYANQQPQQGYQQGNVPQQTPAFGNPFQPFLQQSFNSVGKQTSGEAQQQGQQQPQPLAPPPQQQILQPVLFTPPPAILSPNAIPPPQQGQFFEQQAFSNRQGQQFFEPINYTRQNNDRFQPAQQVFRQQNFVGPSGNQQNGLIQQDIPAQIIQQQRPNEISPQGQAVLHAVPNIIDPYQRPRQLYNFPLQNIRGPADAKFEPSTPILDKAADIKKPSSGTGYFRGEQQQTCPKQPNWEPCVPKEIANTRFRNCCSRLGDGCSQLCSYDQNLTNIQLAVLTGRCPISKVADMMLCASGYEDATACCQAFGVFEPGFEHCRPYCNPAGGLPNDGMLAEKYRCLQKLQQIQRCFYLTQRP